MGESMWLSPLQKWCGRTRPSFSSHLQGWPCCHITYWNPSRKKDILHKNFTRNSRFRAIMSASSTKSKLPSPHSHQWNAVQADHQTVWDSVCIPWADPHTPLAFRGYSPQTLANYTLMVSSSCWHHNRCVSQSHPMADLYQVRMHHSWSSGGTASVSPLEDTQVHLTFTWLDNIAWFCFPDQVLLRHSHVSCLDLLLAWTANWRTRGLSLFPGQIIPFHFLPTFKFYPLPH